MEEIDQQRESQPLLGSRLGLNEENKILMLERNLKQLKSKIIDESTFYSALNALRREMHMLTRMVENSDLRELLEGQEKELHILRDRIQSYAELLSRSTDSLRETRQENEKLIGKQIVDEQYRNQLLAEISNLRESSRLSVKMENGNDGSTIHSIGHAILPKNEELVSNRVQPHDDLEIQRVDPERASYGSDNEKDSQINTLGCSFSNNSSVKVGPGGHYHEEKPRLDDRKNITTRLKRNPSESELDYVIRVLKLSVSLANPKIGDEIVKYIPEENIPSVLAKAKQSILSTSDFGNHIEISEEIFLARLSKALTRSITSVNKNVQEIAEDLVFSSLRRSILHDSNTEVEVGRNLNFMAQLAQLAQSTDKKDKKKNFLSILYEKLISTDSNTIYRYIQKHLDELFEDTEEIPLIIETMRLIVSHNKTCICCNRLHVDKCTDALNCGGLGKAGKNVLLSFRLIGSKSNFRHLRTLLFSSLLPQQKRLVLKPELNESATRIRDGLLLLSLAELVYGFLISNLVNAEISQFLGLFRTKLVELKNHLISRGNRIFIEHMLLHALMQISLGHFSQVVPYIGESVVNECVIIDDCLLCDEIVNGGNPPVYVLLKEGFSNAEWY